MTETEHLDRLLHVIVQEEMRKLLLAKTASIMDELWNWHIRCKKYMRNTISSSNLIV